MQKFKKKYDWIYCIAWWHSNQAFIYATINVLFICWAVKLLPLPVRRSVKYSSSSPLSHDSLFSPGLIVFSEAKPASELSEAMLWMDDRGISVSVPVSHVDSVSLVQLSR